MWSRRPIVDHSGLNDTTWLTKSMAMLWTPPSVDELPFVISLGA